MLMISLRLYESVVEGHKEWVTELLGERKNTNQRESIA